jgi:surface antigen
MARSSGHQVWLSCLVAVVCVALGGAQPVAAVGSWSKMHPQQSVELTPFRAMTELSAVGRGRSGKGERELRRHIDVQSATLTLNHLVVRGRCRANRAINATVREFIDGPTDSRVRYCRQVITGGRHGTWRHPDLRRVYRSRLVSIAMRITREAEVPAESYGTALSIQADRLQITVIFRHPPTHIGRYLARLTLLRRGGSRKMWGGDAPGSNHGASPTEAEAVAIARRRWESEGQEILNGYRNGQCTDWASQKRPDVIERVFEATVVAEVLRRPRPLQLEGAQTWAAAARGVGMTVSNLPAVGALVVWQEGVEGANPLTGHVGYVESLTEDGSTFSTSEMNFGAPYQMGYRTLSSLPVEGRSFIWP